jgi:hypothetical protein
MVLSTTRLMGNPRWSGWFRRAVTIQGDLDSLKILFQIHLFRQLMTAMMASQRTYCGWWGGRPCELWWMTNADQNISRRLWRSREEVRLYLHADEVTSEVQGHLPLQRPLDIMTESQSSYNIFHLNELMKLLVRFRDIYDSNAHLTLWLNHNCRITSST